MGGELIGPHVAVPVGVVRVGRRCRRGAVCPHVLKSDVNASLLKSSDCPKRVLDEALVLDGLAMARAPAAVLPFARPAGEHVHCV